MQIDLNGDRRLKIARMKPTANASGCVSNSDEDQDGPIGTGTYVTELGPADVLLGRGTGPSMNEGNVSFRQLVVDLKPEYVSTSSRKAKKNIVRKAVNGIKAKKGRFLMKLQKGEVKMLGLKKKEVYEVVRDSVAIEKTKQAIRYVHYKKDNSQVRTSPPINSRKDPEQKGLSLQQKTASRLSSARESKGLRHDDLKACSVKEQSITLPQQGAGLSTATINDGHSGPIHALNGTARATKHFQERLMPADLHSSLIAPTNSVLEGLYMNSTLSRILPGGMPLSTMGMNMARHNLSAVPQTTHSLQQGLSNPSFQVNSQHNSLPAGPTEAAIAAHLSSILRGENKAQQADSSTSAVTSRTIAPNERQELLKQSSATMQNSGQLQAILLAEAEHRRRLLGTLLASLPPR